MRRRVVWDADDRVGGALFDARRKTGLTQSELGSKVGCTKAHVSKVELGDQRISVGEFLAWCEALSVDPSEIVKQIEGKS